MRDRYLYFSVFRTRSSLPPPSPLRSGQLQRVACSTRPCALPFLSEAHNEVLDQIDDIVVEQRECMLGKSGERVILDI